MRGVGTLGSGAALVKSSLAGRNHFEFSSTLGLPCPGGTTYAPSHTRNPTLQQNPMANILGIFTAIILAVAAFVAVKNKDRLATEIENRDTEEASLVTSQARLKAAQEELRRLPLETEKVNALAATKTEEETALKTEKDDLDSEISTKTNKISTNKAKLDDIREKTAKIGDIKGLAEKMKSMRIELEELDLVIGQKQASLANLTERNTATQKEATSRKSELDDFSKGKSLASLRTRIRSIYPTWGFVTLADGNNAGVIANSTLDVVRDGQTVAKLLVTAVETRSASASIIPDSMGEEVTLMVGDRVVPGEKFTKEKDTSSASN